MNEKLNWGLFSKYRNELYGFSAIIIMIFHSQVIFSMPGILSTINSLLNCGVEIFLVLSGMCLYFSYTKNSNYNIFIKKRYSRVLIPYFLISFFYWFWRYIIAELKPLDFLHNVSGLSLLVAKNGNSLVIGKPFIWYASFICVMYTLYPLFYKTFFNTKPKKKSINLILLIAASVTVSFFIMFFAKDTYSAIEVASTRVPAFLIGCYLGKAVYNKQAFKPLDFILFFAYIPLRIIVSLVSSSFNVSITNSLLLNRYLGIFLAFTLCFSVVIFLEKLSKAKLIFNPVKKALRFFGEISLELYMTHVMLYNAVLYYYPDIASSLTVRYYKKILIYATILAVSVVLSYIFSIILNKIRGGKNKWIKN